MEATRLIRRRGCAMTEHAFCGWLMATERLREQRLHRMKLHDAEFRMQQITRKVLVRGDNRMACIKAFHLWKECWASEKAKCADLERALHCWLRGTDELELQRILASWAAEVYRSRDQYRHNFQLRDVTGQLRHTVLQLLQKTKARCLLDRVFSAWKQDSSTCVSQHRMSWQWALTLQRCELKRLLHCWLLIAKSLVNETKYHCEVDNLRAKSQHVWHLAYLHKSLVICSSVVSALKHVALFCTKKLGDIRKAVHTWINSSLDLELRSIVRCWAAAVDSSKALRHHLAQVQRLGQPGTT